MNTMLKENTYYKFFIGRSFSILKITKIHKDSINVKIFNSRNNGEIIFCFGISSFDDTNLQEIKGNEECCEKFIKTCREKGLLN